MCSEVWDEITHPFPNFNGCAVEVWEWISNFIPQSHYGCNKLSETAFHKYSINIALHEWQFSLWLHTCVNVGINTRDIRGMKWWILCWTHWRIYLAGMPRIVGCVVTVNHHSRHQAIRNSSCKIFHIDGLMQERRNPMCVSNGVTFFVH